MAEAFSKTRKMAEGIQPHPSTKMNSRALAGWGDNVQPPRSRASFPDAKGPIDRNTRAGGKFPLPTPNMVATLPGGSAKKI